MRSAVTLANFYESLTWYLALQVKHSSEHALQVEGSLGRQTKDWHSLCCCSLWLVNFRNFFHSFLFCRTEAATLSDLLQLHPHSCMSPLYYKSINKLTLEQAICVMLSSWSLGASSQTRQEMCSSNLRHPYIR